MKKLSLIILIGLITAGSAQTSMEPRAVIDTLRWGFEYKSAEAFRRAKQAQNLDSTYFIGHMIEGYHFYDRAEEHTGLRKAVGPLRRALNTFEADFGRSISRRYSIAEIQMGAWRELLRQLDYLQISSALVECYNSLEMPDSSYAALTRLRDANLAFDFRSYQGLAWLFFRSRVYSQERYPFLRESIEENLQQAFLYADSLQMRFDRNKSYLRGQIMGAYPPGSAFHSFFENAFLVRPLGSIANTLGILHGYNFEPRKAANYFMRMDDEESVAKKVNLGYTFHSAIDFRRSEEFFSEVPDKGSKTRGGHWQGYSSIFVFKGEPLAGALQLSEARDSHGFTIGYGWDNLCLARMFLYAGMLDECQASLDKAEKFAEVHFNTSFREDQYQFMLKTLRFMHNQFKLKSRQFETSNKWLSTDWWLAAPGHYLNRWQMLSGIADELALNPEREIVYYHIFHTESLISFDELWEVLQNYSGDFFRSTFEEKRESDPRSNLKRYYDYYLARLALEEGEDQEAYNQLTQILTSPGMDGEYEKLLIARIHEQCASIAEEQGWERELEFHLNQLYRFYPQLIPFSDVRMKFALIVDDALASAQEPRVSAALDEFESVNIGWLDDAHSGYPIVTLKPGENSSTIMFSVEQGREVVNQGSIELDRPDAGLRLAYRLFDVFK